MNEALGLTTTEIVLGFLLGVSMAMHQLTISKHNRTIDKLTDKILGIQVTKEKPTIKEDDVSPVKEDEKLSWHDN